MAKFRVLKTFQDIHTKEVYNKNKEIEMNVERAKEVASNLGDTFLKRLDEPKTKTKKE
ncbi:hypothetical protein [Jeotgalibaca porci]|uniref:hypothetical protein n=1 Tax=Jeotgalibaca porci TaxID=1868793 RepID=UPI0035A09D2C